MIATLVTLVPRQSTGRLAATSLLVLLFAGCATLNLEPPDLNLVNLQLENATLLESSGIVTIRLANANPEPLQVDGMAFDLRLDGRRIGKALSDQKVEIPRLSSVTVDANLNVNHIAIATLIPQAMESEAVSYDLSGKVYVLTEFGRRTLKVKREGRFDFAEGAPLVEDALGESTH